MMVVWATELAQANGERCGTKKMHWVYVLGEYG
jgi:hypothetical protein